MLYISFFIWLFLAYESESGIKTVEAVLPCLICLTFYLIIILCMPSSVPIYYIEFFPVLYFLHKEYLSTSVYCKSISEFQVESALRWNQFWLTSEYFSSNHEAKTSEQSTTNVIFWYENVKKIKTLRRINVWWSSDTRGFPSYSTS